MSESEDDVPISKLVTRLRQEQQKSGSDQDEEKATPPSSTRTPPPSPSSRKNDKEEAQASEKQPETTAAAATKENNDKQEITTAEKEDTSEEEQQESIEKENESIKSKEKERPLEHDDKDASTNEEQKDATQEKPLDKEEIAQKEEIERAQAETEQENAPHDDAKKEDNEAPSAQSDDPPADSVTPNLSTKQEDGAVTMDIDHGLPATPANEPPQRSQDTAAVPMEVESEDVTSSSDEKKVVGTAGNSDVALNEGENEKSEPSESKPENNENMPQTAPESETDELEDAFPAMTLPKKRKNGSSIRAKKQKVGKIKINLKGGSKDSSLSTIVSLRKDEKKSYEDTIRRFEASLYEPYPDDSTGDGEEDPDLMDEFEDSLAFYSETHEDQDPVFIEFSKKREKQRLEKELARLDEEEKMGVIEIEQIAAAQLKEKQASADRNIERLRSKAAMEEQSNVQKLLQIYTEKTASNQAKIDHGIKLLTGRHQQEMQKVAMQYRQQARQRGMSEQSANSEWAKISQKYQLKHQQQMQEFNAKGDEVKKKCEADYNREQEKMRNYHAKRSRDTELLMNKVVSRMHSNFQQQRQRHLLRHAAKMKKKKALLLSAMGVKDAEISQENDEDKSVQEGDNEFWPLSNILAFDEKEGEGSGAAARQKHRKKLLGAIQKQLSVEIHNEGLWITSLLEKKDDSKKEECQKSQSSKGTDSKENETEFIPWGVQAHTILHSIVSGNIPVGYGPDRFDFGNAIATQGGHIRCVVTDMRTSEATASFERAAAMKEHEEIVIADLENKSKKFSELLIDAEKNHARAEADEKECAAAAEKSRKEHEKVKQMLNDFKTKFKDYFGPDGTPVTSNPSDRQRLMQAMVRYKTSVEAAENREKTVVKALSDAKMLAQKMHTVVRQTQKAAIAAAAMLKRKKATLSDGKNVGRGGRTKLSDAAELARASNRVSDVIYVLRRTADRRRDQLNQKKSSSASSTWVHSLPGVSGPLKKSLWHKMHKRRQQIVLRPTMESTATGLKESVLTGPPDKQSAPTSDDLDKALRAEQLFLLTAFPVAPSEPLPSVPCKSSSDPWAEPGWHVVLDVPKDTRRSSALLPCAPSFSILQKNQTEFSSAPGRQAASMLKIPYMRTFSAPLSAAAQAISLTETNPSVLSSSISYSENDPLNSSEATLLAGYTFPSKTTAKAPSQARKRTPSTVSKEEKDSTAAPKGNNSGEAATSGQLTANATSSTAERRGSTERKGSTERRASTERRSSASKTTKRSRSKANTENSPRAKRKSKTAAGAPQQALESHAQYMQQQPGSAPMGVRGVYGQQQQPTMEQQAAQYNQFMQQQMPSVSSPSQAGQQQHVTLQQLQSQQQQMQVPPQQQLLPQPHQQYASPQQFHQQQQHHLAQMRMMQQQQQQSGRQSQVPPSYGQPQAPQGMQAFYPPGMPQQATRQKSYGGQQPMPVPMNRGGMGQPVMGGPSSTSPRRGSQQQIGDDSQHDPLLFLNGDM